MFEFEVWPELARVRHDNEDELPPKTDTDDEYEAACADAWDRIQPVD